MPSYIGFVQHRLTHSCPVTALGRFLVVRFTLGEEQFPIPDDVEGWNKW